MARWAQNWNRQHKNSEFWSAKLSKLHWVRLQRGICPFHQFATSLGGQIYVKYLFLTSFVFAKSCIPDFFHDFQTDLLSIQEEMLWNSFLTSTISTCPLEYQFKIALFCIFHIIFTGFSLSWTRRVLRQARIRDVKYYINSELSPVLKGVFPQTTGCTLESGPSLHSRSNCFWGDVALALHTPRRLRHEKTMVQKGRGTKSFWYTVRQSFNEK